MHSISSTSIDPRHLEQLREWFVSEWGAVDAFSSTNSEVRIPAPIVATEGYDLLGGLAFTIARKPNSADVGMWVNAVLVAPEYRKLGIGSSLIQAAESEAKRTGEKDLFVYTEFPELYEKLGWVVQDTDGDSKVLKKELANG